MNPSNFYRMYSADSKVYLLNHFKSFRQAATSQLATMQSDDGLKLSLSFAGHQVFFYPQFLEISDDGPVYTNHFTADAVCFTGWRPYQPIGVKPFSDKLLLKQLLMDHGFAVPAFSDDPRCQWHDVIVKSRHGSFGKGMRGPFRATDEYLLRPEDGEYYECFMPGTILKIAYWDGAPVSIEAQAMPVLTGDGKRSLLEMAHERAKQRGRDGMDEWALDEVLAYQGYSVDTVLASGEEVMADFRYESDFLMCHAVEEMAWPHPRFTSLKDTFERMGAFLMSMVKQEGVPHLYYSVDAVLSEDGVLYCLEVNANPTVHPCAYPVMVASMVHEKKSTAVSLDRFPA